MWKVNGPPLEPPKIRKREKPRQLQGLGGSLDLEVENLLEDSVMCRSRAKRGCATHPRSIAERERRTLQELVPNMDKQTNTADMLEKAVAYVKHLQKEVQIIWKLFPRPHPFTVVPLASGYQPGEDLYG
ncbi:transcription factor bHLH80-like [Salvia splendens]|uniref:transcription factor bHLH80-like n=1 Tax=Salvia splendens TaxID=180675 RepID=UPI001C26FAEC|nr:transcription factor bHLH80-like [Salvia splendens]